MDVTKLKIHPGAVARNVHLTVIKKQFPDTKIIDQLKHRSGWALQYRENTIAILSYGQHTQAKIMIIGFLARLLNRSYFLSVQFGFPDYTRKQAFFIHSVPSLVV